MECHTVLVQETFENNMAEGGHHQASTPQGKINLVCRYFIHGVCSKGSDCVYLHDKSRSVPMDNICKYYQLGNCSYGEKCRYDHVKKEGKRQSKPAQTQTKKPIPPQSFMPTMKHTDSRPNRMVTLKKGGIDHSIKESEKKKQEEEKWASAKCFVPGQKYHGSVPGSYAEAIGNDQETSETSSLPQFQQGATNVGNGGSAWSLGEKEIWDSFSWEPTGIGGLPASAITDDTPLCPYYAAGSCPYHDECPYAHGDICDYCGMPQLHPVNQRLRDEHVKECVEQHEKEMLAAFAIQASEDKECGICLENVLSKEPGPCGIADRRFGILENCNHCFCLTCLRQWRGNTEVSIETHRSCPTCRTHSDFITPSKYWPSTPEEKKKLIMDYKKALRAKPCQYFKKGKGECPFNTKCFYLHALEDGTVATENLVKRRWRTNADGEHAVSDDDISLWDFINSRDSAGLDQDLTEELELLLLEIFQDNFRDDSSGNSDMDS